MTASAGAVAWAAAIPGHSTHPVRRELAAEPLARRGLRCPSLGRPAPRQRGHRDHRELTRQAFGRQFEVDFLDNLRADPVAWIPGLSIRRHRHRWQVVAHALLSRCTIGETPVLCLGPVAVLPAYQGQGVGGASS